MSIVRWSAVLAAALMSSACTEEPTTAAPPVVADWVGMMVRLDPIFGGGNALVERVEVAPHLRWAGDADARAQMLGQKRQAMDAAARSFVAEMLPETVAAEAGAFLRSKAGQALLAAEATAIMGGAGMFDDLPTRLGARAGDPEKVKDAAERFRAVAEKHVDRGAVSPFLLAELLALSAIPEADAKAIGRFLATGSGATWLKIRTDGWPAARRRIESALAELQKAGFLEDTLAEALPDLLLPRADGPDSVEKRDRTGR